ncbi:MAG: LicD family protein [Oligoflexia bacterium]|nr:LicD family protein [Oligoflexia bacterium]
MMKQKNRLLLLLIFTFFSNVCFSSNEEMPKSKSEKVNINKHDANNKTLTITNKKGVSKDFTREQILKIAQEASEELELTKEIANEKLSVKCNKSEEMFNHFLLKMDSIFLKMDDSISDPVGSFFSKMEKEVLVGDTSNRTFEYNGDKGVVVDGITEHDLGVTPKKNTDQIYYMLNIINKVFAKNNIPYVAEGGTLIGAIRHGGIIPWDDDADIDLREEDFGAKNLTENIINYKLKLGLYRLEKEFNQYGLGIRPTHIGAQIYFINKKETSFLGLNKFNHPHIPKKVEILKQLHPRLKEVSKTSAGYNDSFVDIFPVRKKDSDKNYTYSFKSTRNLWPKAYVPGDAFTGTEYIKFGHEKLQIPIPPLKSSIKSLMHLYGTKVLEEGYRTLSHMQLNGTFSDKKIKITDFKPATPPTDLEKIPDITRE